MVDFRKMRMVRAKTPVENHVRAYGLFVKREDLSCPPPGPPFSKARGVYAHLAGREESVIGVLDTYHSQAGWAVARACEILGKRCYNFYPRYKADGTELREPQKRSAGLGAQLIALPAGRSCILYHSARKQTEAMGGYMMPNALKLPESVSETAKEVPDETFDTVIVPSSSATIAAGVVRGFAERFPEPNMPRFLIHLGYSRSREEVERYVREASGCDRVNLRVIDEGYAYKDRARPGPTPKWPCNEYYDLKAFRWWFAEGREAYPGRTLLWNIG